jgi:zinc protease
MESIGMPLGQGANAATSYDETTYRLTVPMDNPAHLETAIRIVRDWADRLTLDPEEIDRERGVVIEEWRARRGAGTRVRDLQAPVIFRGSRYAERDVIGTVESLQTFEHAALRRFYEDWYRPELMAVIAVGDFNREAVEELLRDQLSNIPPSENPPERTMFAVPSHEETLYSIVTDPELPTTSISVYHKMDPIKDWTVGGYRDRIIQGLYNTMLNERLSEVAREPNAPFLGASSAKGSLVRAKDVYLLAAAVQAGGVERGLGHK